MSTPTPDAAKVAELIALARSKGCDHVTFDTGVDEIALAKGGGWERVSSGVDAGVMTLSLVWEGRPYELTFDISKASAADVDFQLDLMRDAVLRLTSGRQEAQP